MTLQGSPYRKFGEVEPDPPEPKKRYSYHLVARNPYNSMHASHFGFIIGWSIASIVSDQWVWFLLIALYALMTPLVVKVEKKELLNAGQEDPSVPGQAQDVLESDHLLHETQRAHR